MAIIYTYPEINQVEGEDLLLISDTSLHKRPTRSVTVDDLALYIGTVVGVVQNLQSVLTVGNTYVNANGHGTFTLNDITNSDGQIKYVNTDEGWGYTLNAEEGLMFTDGSGSGTGFTTIGRNRIYIGNDNYIGEISSSSITANRTYALPNASGTIALTSDIGGPYLPLTGGTLSGNLAIVKSQPTLTLVDGTKVSYLQNINGSLYHSAWLGDNIFQSNSGQTMVIKQNGNVGIGTTNPSGILNVVGGITKLNSSNYSTNVLSLESSSSYSAMVIGADSFATSGMVNVSNSSSSGNNEIGMNFATGGFSSSNVKLSILNTGQLKAHSYGSGSFTGTATQRLAVDTNGNVIEIPVGSGPVDGSGTANYTARWIDTDTLGIGTLYDNGTNVGIGTTSPSEKLEVYGGNLIVNDGTSKSRLRPSDLYMQQAGVIKAWLRADGNSYLNGGNVGNGTTSPGNKLTIEGPSSNQFEIINSANNKSWRPNVNGNDFYITESGVSNPFVIQAGGNVGIGTTNPTVSLQLGAFGTADKEFRIESSGNSYFSVLTSNGVQKIYAGGAGTQSNEIAFYTSNSGAEGERMRITSSGNVGIGTTSPDSLLEISTTDTTKDFIKLTSGGGSVNPSLVFEKSTAEQGVIQYIRNGDLKIYNTDNDGGVMLSGSGATNYDMYINNSGNVGIGTTSPGVKLDVDGQIRSDDSFLLQSGTTAIGSIRNQGGAFDIRANSTRDVSIGSISNPQSLFVEGTNGNVGIGTTSPSQKLEVAGNIQATGARNISASYDANHYMRIESNANGGVIKGTDGGVITTLVRTYGDSYFNGGNVGIGTTSPAANFHVTGSSSSGNLPIAKIESTGNVSYLKFFNSSTGTGASDGTYIGMNGGTAYLINKEAGNLYLGTGNDLNLTLQNGGNVGIGTTSPQAKLDISSTGTGDSMIIRNNDASSSAAPVLMLLRDSASAANGDYLGQIKFKGNSDTGAERVYAKVTAKISDATNGAEDSLIETAVRNNGANLIVSRQTNTDLKLINGVGLEVDGDVQFGAYGAGTLITDANGNVSVSSGGGAGGPYLPIAGGTMTGNTNHSDNVKDRYGTGNDFQIWHDGSNTFLSNEGEGHLNIMNTGDDRDIIFKTDDGSGATTSYMVVDGSAEQTRFYKDTRYTDGIKAYFGNANDLELSHDGNNSWITNATGDLKIYNNANDKDIVLASDDGSGGTTAYLTLDGSTTHAYFSNPGNVGIGTTSPEAKLTIKGDALNTNQPVKITNSITDTHTGLFLNNTGATVGEKYGMQFGGYNQYSIGGIFGVLDSVSGSTSGDITFDLGNGTSAGSLIERMRITHEGKVGIGTTSPGYKLEVDGTARITSALTFGGNVNNIIAGTGSSLDFKSNGEYYFRKGANTNLTISSDGKVGIGTTSPLEKLQINSGDVLINNSSVSTLKSGGSLYLDLNTFGSLGGRNFRVQNNGTVHLNIDSTGKVGIGTTAPSEKLHVNGEVRVDGNDGVATKKIRSSYFSSSQNLDLQSGSSADIILTSDKVGIGETSPDSKLHVHQTGSGTLTTIITEDDARKLFIGRDAINCKDLNNNAALLYLNQAGGNVSISNKLGIGTTSPTSQLDVRGGAIIAGSTPSAPIGTASTLEVYENGDDATLAIHQDNIASTTKFAQIRFRNGGNDTYIKTPTSGQALIIDTEQKANAFAIHVNGNVGIGTSSPNQKLQVGGNLHVYDEEGDTDAAIFISTGTSNTTTVTVRSNGDSFFNGGNVGIGTTSPLSKLNVNGDIKIEGENELYFGSSGSVPLWEIKASGSDLVINDTGSNVGSVLFNNDEGIVLPRLTTTEINAISLPNTGLTVYNTTLNTICFYNGSSWQKVNSANM